MSSPISTQSPECAGSTPTVSLDELSQDELRLVASFVNLVRTWREARTTAADEFQLLWRRMKAKVTDKLDDDEVMNIAIEAQREVRRARV
jgi:hypothetical protein